MDRSFIVDFDSVKLHLQLHHVVHLSLLLFISDLYIPLDITVKFSPVLNIQDFR